LAPGRAGKVDDIIVASGIGTGITGKMMNAECGMMTRKPPFIIHRSSFIVRE
jgi:hypothetical protein